MRQAEQRRREELKKRQIEAGLVGDRFPEVEGIMMKITYYHRHAFADTDRVLMLRTMNISPDDNAYFHLQCPEKECDAEYDMDKIIKDLVKNRKKKLAGEMVCTKKGPYLPQRHSSIQYEIEIKYGRKRS